jgi:hypothetical protein
MLVHFGVTHLLVRLKVAVSESREGGKDRAATGRTTAAFLKMLAPYVPFADLIFTASMVNRSGNYRLSIPTDAPP